MRAYLSVQFDKPIKKDCYYISPGSYAVQTESGTEYLFDFFETEGWTDKENPTIVHFIIKDEDYDTFPDTVEFKKHIHEITRFDECYIHIETNGESSEITPVEVLEFTIKDWVEGKPVKVESTEFVTVREEKETGGSALTCTFTKKLLATCEIFPHRIER